MHAHRWPAVLTYATCTCRKPVIYAEHGALVAAVGRAVRRASRRAAAEWVRARSEFVVSSSEMRALQRWSSSSVLSMEACA